MSGTVLYERSNRVVTLTLNRPERLNAFNSELDMDLREAIAQFVVDPEARVAVITGAGRAFSAGADLTAPRKEPGDDKVIADKFGLDRSLEFLLSIWEAPKPIIAAVNGYAIGRGNYLQMFCDCSFAAEDAQIGAPSMPLGAGMTSIFMTWLMGPRRAKQFTFRSGARMTGIEAARYGLINDAFPAKDLIPEVMAIAHDMAKVPESVLRMQKQSINSVWEMQGYHASVKSGAQWDALGHEVPEIKITVKEWIRELGVSRAVEKFAAEGL